MRCEPGPSRTSAGTREAGELVEEQPRADGGLDHTAPGRAQRLGDRLHLGEVSRAARHRLARVADVGGRLGRSKTDRAGIDRRAHDGAHLRDLVRRGRALGSVLTHHVQPQRRMADQNRHVDRRPTPLNRVEVLWECFERPVAADAGFQRGEAHALDLLQRTQDETAVRWPGRGDAEAAIAHHHRGDAMPR
jgi:hypothetical protein